MRTVTALALMLCADVFGAAGSDAEEVRGVSGGSLTVRCRYPKDLVKYKQYWCKGADWLSCSIIVQSTGSEEAVTRGRFTLKDNHKTRTFTVTITGLREDDSGLYWCGIERPGTDTMYQVKVTVSKSDPGFYQTEKASTTTKGLPVTASVSPCTPSVLQSSVPENVITASVSPDTPPGLHCSAKEEINTAAVTPDAPHTPTASPSSYLVLQWQVKDVLIGLIPLTGVITWIKSRKRKESPGGEGLHWVNSLRRACWKTCSVGRGVPLQPWNRPRSGPVLGFWGPWAEMEFVRPL